MADGRRQFTERVKELNRLFRDSQPRDTENWLFVPRQGQPYAAGTTVPMLGQQFVPTPSGLLLPVAAARGPDPIDLIATYLTAEEVAGRSIPFAAVLDRLKAVDVERALTWCAGVLARKDAPGANRREVDLELATVYLQDPPRTGVLNQLRAGRVLATPQGLLTLAKLSLLHCQGEEQLDEPIFLPLLLAVQSAMGGDQTDFEPTFTGTTTHPLFRSVVSSAWFSRDTDPVSTMATLQLRWRDHPDRLREHPQWVDLPARFADATGLQFDEFLGLGTALWAAASNQRGAPIPISYFSTLGFEQARLDLALSLVSAAPGALATALSKNDEAFGGTWSFDPLRQRPVIRLSGDRLLVISPSLLFERFFGWLPIYDLVSGLRKKGNKTEAAQADTFFRRSCEAEAVEAIEHIAGPRGDRLFLEEDLQAAFGTAQQTADAAVDYGDAWVVMEISTHQLTRESVVGGSPEALECDLEFGIIDKARQIDATIEQLRIAETLLTGGPARTRRKYVPVLVATEGFPVNPMTMLAIEDRLKAAAVLQGQQIGPLHILDQEELHMLEGLAEHGGPSLLALLEEHEVASLRNMGLKDYLLVGRRPPIAGDRPARLDTPFQAVWAIALEALRRTAGKGQPDDGESPNGAGAP